MIGDELTPTHFKFLRGIDGKNGKCYGLPAWGEGVLKIDAETGETSIARLYRTADVILKTVSHIILFAWDPERNREHPGRFSAHTRTS